MSRTIMEYTLGKPDDFVQFIANDYFTKEGFRPILYKGEQVWKKGTGFLVAPSFIKLQYGQGVIHLEAWIKSFGEHDLDGAYAAIPKSQLRSRVDTLLQLLSQPLPNQTPAPQQAAANPGYPGSPDLSSPAAVPYANGATAPAPQAINSAPVYAPIPVKTHNPTGQAIASLIVGLVALIAAWFSSYFGILISIVAICLGAVGKRSTLKGLGIAGFVVGIVTLVLSVIVWILNIVILLS